MCHGVTALTKDVLPQAAAAARPGNQHRWAFHVHSWSERRDRVKMRFLSCQPICALCKGHDGAVGLKECGNAHARCSSPPVDSTLPASNCCGLTQASNASRRAPDDHILKWKVEVVSTMGGPDQVVASTTALRSIRQAFSEHENCTSASYSAAGDISSVVYNDAWLRKIRQTLIRQLKRFKRRLSTDKDNRSFGGKAGGGTHAILSSPGHDQRSTWQLSADALGQPSSSKDDHTEVSPFVCSTAASLQLPLDCVLDCVHWPS